MLLHPTRRPRQKSQKYEYKKAIRTTKSTREMGRNNQKSEVNCLGPVAANSGRGNGTTTPSLFPDPASSLLFPSPPFTRSTEQCFCTVAVCAPQISRGEELGVQTNQRRTAKNTSLVCPPNVATPKTPRNESNPLLSRAIQPILPPSFHFRPVYVCPSVPTHPIPSRSELLVFLSDSVVLFCRSHSPVPLSLHGHFSNFPINNPIHLTVLHYSVLYM
jgi:hypothetical protein